jgi:hypothetical protein
MRRTARISAAYAPRGAGRIGAAPGDERAHTGITEQEQQTAPASILAEQRQSPNLAPAQSPASPTGHRRHRSARIATDPPVATTMP